MAVKRKVYSLRGGDVLEIEEFHNGRFGYKQQKRLKKKEVTPEQVAKQNRIQKAKNCRHKLIEYFDKKDLFITWTYKPSERPEDMQAALKDFQKAIRKVKREYEKKGKELFWIRNIERGTKGAWHIHLVVNEIGGSAAIVKDAWTKGGVWCETIGNQEGSGEEWYVRLSEYLTKSEKTVELKKDGTPSKPKIKESSYNTSRNMPIRPPEVERLKRWYEVPLGKKGYVLAEITQDINQHTHFPWRKYTLIRTERRQC